MINLGSLAVVAGVLVFLVEDLDQYPSATPRDRAHVVARHPVSPPCYSNEPEADYTPAPH